MKVLYKPKKLVLMNVGHSIKGSLRRRLGRGSKMQAKDSAHVHSLNAATQKTTQHPRSSLRRNLKASLGDSERQCYLHGLNVSTTAGFQIAKRGGLPAGR